MGLGLGEGALMKAAWTTIGLVAADATFNFLEPVIDYINTHYLIMIYLSFIISLWATFYFFFCWKKFKYKEFFWLTFLCASGMIIKLYDYFVSHVFNFSDRATTVSNTITHYSWLIILVILAILAIKLRRRQKGIKKQGNGDSQR
jgi:hypothetical protein